ncbi:hypothetical protein [Pseudomonas sp. EL_65y_Pfl1_R83]|uniref:hypothetical protein n=1 Tax=Pseudomonas sp. EL_65y_Pfl1_R83 TaxID=3088697 RepID=UPI00403F0C0B
MASEPRKLTPASKVGVGAGIGALIAPSDISSLLTRPLLPPNRSAQPSVRATTEIRSGPRITSRKTLFQRPLMRLRM